MLCEVFSVHRSSFKYWKTRSKRPECIVKAMEIAKITKLFEDSEGSAGARSIAQMATDQDVPLSRYRASRLMKKLGLISCQIPSHTYKKTGNEYVEISNELDRQFNPDEPNRVYPRRRIMRLMSCYRTTGRRLSLARCDGRTLTELRQEGALREERYSCSTARASYAQLDLKLIKEKVSVLKPRLRASQLE